MKAKAGAAGANRLLRLANTRRQDGLTTRSSPLRSSVQRRLEQESTRAEQWPRYSFARRSGPPRGGRERALSTRRQPGVQNRESTRRGFRIRGKRPCSAWSDVAARTSIVSDTTGDYPARSVAVGCEQYRRQRCPQVIVCITGAGLWRLLATTAMRRVSRFRRSPGGWDGPRPRGHPLF